MDYSPPPKSPQVEIAASSKDKLKVAVNKYERLIVPLNNALYDLIDAVKQERPDVKSFEMLQKIMELRRELVDFFEVDIVEKDINRNY